MSKKRKCAPYPEISGPALIEQLRAHAQRRAPQIAGWGWRPNRDEIRDLMASAKDATAYRTLFRAWRRAGFRTSAIRKFAGRTRNRDATTRQLAAAQMEN
jgi:hypothetical protein